MNRAIAHELERVFEKVGSDQRLLEIAGSLNEFKPATCRFLVRQLAKFLQQRGADAKLVALVTFVADARTDAAALALLREWNEQGQFRVH